MGDSKEESKRSCPNISGSVERDDAGSLDETIWLVFQIVVNESLFYSPSGVRKIYCGLTLPTIL